MSLIEEVNSLPLNSSNQQVIIREVQQVTSNVLGAPPPPPSNIPRAPLPKKSFKGSLANLKLLLDVKTKLLNRKKYREAIGEELEQGEFVITDESYLSDHEQKQFTEEIAKIQKQIEKIENQEMKN